MGPTIFVIFLSLAFIKCNAHLLRKREQSLGFVTDASNSTCAKLTNEGSHFTVDINVGTPGQTFSVVADTGSDSVIVPSCICQHQGWCSAKDRCFTGTNKSSTFFLNGVNSTELQTKQPSTMPVVSLTFGSGTLQAVVASDVVHVAGLEASMTNSLLLMVQNQIQIQGSFEGILGLGQPKNETEIKRRLKEQEKERMKELAAAAKKQRQEIEKIKTASNASGGRDMNKMKDMIKAAIGGGIINGIEDGGAGNSIEMSKIADEEWQAIANILKQAMVSGGGGMESAIASIAQQHPAGLRALATSTNQHPISGLLGLGDSSSYSDDEPESTSYLPSFLSQFFSLLLEPLSPILAALWSVLEPIKIVFSAEMISDKAPKHAEQSSENGTEKFKLGQESFLQAAGIDSFSICFNDQGKEGALHFAPPKAKTALSSVGTVHWGVDFQGISIGNASAPVQFCSPSSKKKGQDSACGGIPDSGTTLFMGPEKHILKLYEGICDRWERCRTAVSTGLQKQKAEIFAMLLAECGNWITKEKGLDEMPHLHFQLADAHGKKQTLALGGAGYIVEQTIEDVKMTKKNFLGIPLSVAEPTGNFSKVCSPAFGPMEMETRENGPVWILGSPLFYEYTVGYDLNKNNPAVSFTKQPCGCSKDISLVSDDVHQGKTRARQPRLLTGLPRVSNFDLSMGL